MGVISKAQVTERFFQDGVNSSHFIWLVGQFEFYETFRGWVFAYVKVGRLTLIALEPMVSRAAVHAPEEAPEHIRDLLWFTS